MMIIRVPATSANLGPGFDSCGIALNRYLTIQIGSSSPKWEIRHELGPEIPNDEQNLLVQTALKVLPSLSPHVISMKSEIPLTKGLGSSSSVIIAGIELANQLGKLALTREEKVEIATKMEGHPDNVAPAVLGDFVLASFVNEKVKSVQHHFPEVGVVGFIPDFELPTSASRKLLPQDMSREEAVIASSIANVMIGAILKNDMVLAGEMIEEDLFHEKYRKALVPHIETVRQFSKKFGAYATYLSGAGPTTITFLPMQKAELFARELTEMNLSASAENLEIDRLGVQIFNI